MQTTQVHSIDDYIAGFPEDLRVKLEQLRAAIRKAAPEAEEAIAYAMPTFRLHGNLVHFAAFKNHIGFYPTPTGVKAFEKELAPYKSSKGTMQLPLDGPLPLSLITRMVQHRVKENKAKAAAKKK